MEQWLVVYSLPLFVWTDFFPHSQEHRTELISKCVVEEPHHSPVWQSIAKDDKNAGKSIKEILEMAADALD